MNVPEERPKGLRGNLDSPAPGDILTGRSVVVRGWYAWNGAPALAVAVRVDYGTESRTVVVPTGTDPRPDVAEAFGEPALAGAGWSALVELPDPGSGPAPASAKVTATVWPGADILPVGCPPVELVVPPDVMPAESIDIGMARDPAAENAPRHAAAHLDVPSADVLERRVTKLEGWALFGASPADRVEVFLNGDSLGNARLGMDRLDVALRWTTPHAVISGFEILLDLGSVSPRTRWAHVLVRASGPDGARAAVERWFEVADAVAAAPERVGRRDLLAARTERRVGALRGTGSPDDALNLAVFTHSLELGGAQLWLAEILRRTGAGDRYPCTVIAPLEGPLLDTFEAQGIEVHVSAEPPWHDIEAYHGRVTELALFLAAGGQNAVLANTIRCVGGADAGLRAGLPVVWKIHESWVPRKLWPTFFHPWQVVAAVERRFEEVAAAVDAVVFNARSTSALYEGVSKRTIVVPYGVDVAALDEYASTTRRAAARAALGLPADGRVVLVMGSTEPRKAQTLVASALVEVGPRHPDVTVALVGQIDTPYSAALRAFVSQRALRERVLVVPFTDDAWPWYRAADVLLCASDVEAMPRTVLEAMAFGLPVVATEVFGLGELLTDGDTAYLYPPNDRAALVGVLDRVLDEEPTALAEVAARGRVLVERWADSRDYSEDVLALLGGLRGRRGAAPVEILAAAGRDPASRLPLKRT